MLKCSSSSSPDFQFFFVHFFPPHLFGSLGGVGTAPVIDNVGGRGRRLPIEVLTGRVGFRGHCKVQGTTPAYSWFPLRNDMPVPVGLSWSSQQGRGSQVPSQRWRERNVRQSDVGRRSTGRHGRDVDPVRSRGVQAGLSDDGAGGDCLCGRGVCVRKQELRVREGTERVLDTQGGLLVWGGWAIYCHSELWGRGWGCCQRGCCGGPTFKKKENELEESRDSYSEFRSCTDSPPRTTVLLHIISSGTLVVGPLDQHQTDTGMYQKTTTREPYAKNHFFESRAAYGEAGAAPAGVGAPRGRLAGSVQHQSGGGRGGTDVVCGAGAEQLRKSGGSSSDERWGGNRLAYPHRTGFRPVPHVGSAESMSQCQSDLRSPCHTVSYMSDAQSCRICGVSCRMHSVISGHAQVLTEFFPKTNLKVWSDVFLPKLLIH